MAGKLYIETYGCQMNVSDTEVIFSILGKEGYQRTASMEEADVILANTCSVRDNAEQRIWGRIELFHKQKQIRKDVIVGIVGCMAERLKDKLIETGKVDLVAGPDSYRSLPRLLRDIAPDKPQIDVLLSHEETYADIVPVRTDRAGVSAFISVTASILEASGAFSNALVVSQHFLLFTISPPMGLPKTFSSPKASR